MVVPVATASKGGSLVAFCQFGGLPDTFCPQKLLRVLLTEPLRENLGGSSFFPCLQPWTGEVPDVIR